MDETNESKDLEIYDNSQIFTNSEFGDIRTFLIDGEVWFGGAKVTI